MVTPYPPIFGTPFWLVYAYLVTLYSNYLNESWTYCLASLFWDRNFESRFTLWSRNKDFSKIHFFENIGSEPAISCSRDLLKGQIILDEFKKMTNYNMWPQQGQNVNQISCHSDLSPNFSMKTEREVYKFSEVFSCFMFLCLLAA